MWATSTHSCCPPCEALDFPEAVTALESITALGRMGQPEDVADVVGFLVGPQGRWVTGQTIDASGGTYLGPLVSE